MRVIVGKPRKGLVNLRFDGTRDITRFKKRLVDVPLASVDQEASRALADWETQRKAKKDALRNA